MAEKGFQFLVAESCLNLLRAHTAEVFSPKDPIFLNATGEKCCMLNAAVLQKRDFLHRVPVM